MNFIEIVIIIIFLVLVLTLGNKIITFLVMVMTYSTRDLIDYIKYISGKKKYKTYKSFWKKIANDYARENYIGDKDPFEALMEKLNSKQ